MKIRVNLGDEFKDCKIELPKVVSVTHNFDNSKVLGVAEIKKEGDSLFAEIDCTVEVAGIVTGREGNKITGFDLHSVSIVPKR